MLKLTSKKTKFSESENTNSTSKYQEEIIYVGIDVHKTQWTVSVIGADLGELSRDNFLIKGKICSSNVKSLLQLINSKIEYKKIVVAYEAGFSGFWIYRDLEELGIRTIVANPADIPTTGKESMNKTDRRDSKKIALSLRAGLLESIYVPNREEEEKQAISRRRTDLVRKKTRIINQIKSLINKFGIKLDAEVKAFGPTVIKALQNYGKEHPTLSIIINSMLKEYHQIKEEIKIIDALLVKTMESKEHKSLSSSLKTIPGVGDIVASALILELYNIERFSTFSRFASYIGLIPSEHSSGNKQRHGSLTKRSRTHLKYLLIQATWKAVKCDEGLQQYYRSQLQKNLTPAKAIIKCCRKLLAIIYHVMKYKEDYKPVATM